VESATAITSCSQIGVVQRIQGMPAFERLVAGGRFGGRSSVATATHRRQWGGRSARVRGNTTRPMRAARDATIDDLKEAPMKVTLTEPGLAGSYDVVEQRNDGTLVLRPETSDEVIEQFSDRVLTAEEFVGSLERLHAVKLREEQ